MIVYNFYKFQLISTNNKLNFNNITNDRLLLNVIKTLQKTYKDVNFIKFFVGYGGIVFLSDKDIGDYNKLSIIATNSHYRPRHYNSALIKIDKLMHIYKVDVKVINKTNMINLFKALVKNEDINIKNMIAKNISINPLL